MGWYLASAAQSFVSRVMTITQPIDALVTGSLQASRGTRCSLSSHRRVAVVRNPDRQSGDGLGPPRCRSASRCRAPYPTWRLA
ncbi:hypothetical protein [Bradyrhizobium sp. 163]|uniref:hypothetical protein n=1 Tax=unclassified Bradyrhizobium TaxID=2631580 RepID=UPI0032084EB5